MIPIYLTSWHRQELTRLVIEAIYSRTKSPFTLTIFDNGSDAATQSWLISLLQKKVIHALHLERENTGVCYNKPVFHALTETTTPYYVVTDNDFIPADGWDLKLIEIMEQDPELALLAPQYWPQWPMQVQGRRPGYWECIGVGNTFKMCRMSAMEKVFPLFPRRKMQFGDDGLLSDLVRSEGYRVGFAEDVFCWDLGNRSPENHGGYTEAQLASDPRKQGYNAHPPYEPQDWNTLRPREELIYR